MDASTYNCTHTNTYTVTHALSLWFFSPFLSLFFPANLIYFRIDNLVCWSSSYCLVLGWFMQITLTLSPLTRIFVRIYLQRWWQGNCKKVEWAASKILCVLHFYILHICGCINLDDLHFPLKENINIFFMYTCKAFSILFAGNGRLMVTPTVGASGASSVIG